MHPGQVAEVMRRHPQLGKARLVIAGAAGADQMTLRVETTQGNDALAQTLVAALRDVTKLRGEVDFVALGSLPNDGKVIEDLRTYD